MPHSFAPSRRTVLRGLGVTIALPWLEAIPIVARAVEPGAKPAQPRRFAALFMGNGISPKIGRPRGPGPRWN